MGAGAGYDVKIKGLELDLKKFDITKIKDNEVFFEVPIKKGIVDYWKAEGYYESVDSEGIYYDGELVMDYDKEDRKVEGGKLYCILHLEAVDYRRFEDYENPTREEIENYISDYMDTSIDVSHGYGFGWIHVNLDPKGFTLGGDGDEVNDGEYYGEFTAYQVDIIAPNMANDVNWFFENSYNFEEIFFGGDDEFEESKKSNKNCVRKSLREKRISTEDKIQALAEYKGVEVDEVEEGYDDNYFEVDGEEWIVADYDTAYDLAVEDVRSIMEDDLGLEVLSESAQEWAIYNACDSDWFDDAQKESHEFYAQDVWEEDDVDYGNRAIQELADNERLNDDEGGFVIEVSKDGNFFYVDRKGNLTKDLYKAKRFLTSSNTSDSKEFNKYYDLLDEEYDDVYDTFEEELVDKDDICERLADSMWEDDSIEWYRNNFGDDELSEVARDKGLFDWIKIAEYVVDSDGIANSLSNYDGREVELTKDLYGYRIN